MNKKMLIIILVILVIIGGGVGSVFYLMSGVSKSVDNFFSLIKNGDIDGAYQATSQKFKEGSTLDQFKSFVENSSMADFDSVSWGSKNVSLGHNATFVGSLKTKDNKVIPIKIILVKEDGQWNIFNIDFTMGGVPQIKTIPNDLDLVKLTNDTVLSFAGAVKNNNFSDFYNSISKLWQNQVTVQQFTNLFKSFIDSKVDLTVLKDTTPVFSDKPIIQDNGELVLTGYYLYQGSTLNFTLKYVYENTDWKLSGIDISTK